MPMYDTAIAMQTSTRIAEIVADVRVSHAAVPKRVRDAQAVVVAHNTTGQVAVQFWTDTQIRAGKSKLGEDTFLLLGLL